MIYNVEELNRCFNFDPAQYVTKAEKKYRQQIKKCVEPILRSHTYKFILLSGPSSSGKTTTSYLIKEQLELNGYSAKVVSLDNFFVERVNTPLLPNGKKDYESVDAIDWKLFNKVMKELIENKKARLPIYDFISGTKHLAEDYTTLRDNEIIIIEGLHGLNPIIDNYIPTKLAYKVYLNTESEFAYDGIVIVNKEEIKLVRRLIRDFKKRGATPSTTFSNWPEVLHGEDTYISPYKRYANFKIDTTHSYELCIYYNILQKIQNGLDEKDIKLQMLITKLAKFKKLSHQFAPKNSLIQEFLGGNDN